MKTLIQHTLVASLLAGLLLTAAAQQADSQPSRTPAPSEASAAASAVAATLEAKRASETAPATTTATPAANADGEKLITMNFRGALLETVLVHMSEAAGFSIQIDSKISLRGRVTVIATQPVNREEAFKLLAAALHQNNLGVQRDGRALSVMSIEDIIKHTEIVPSGTPAAQIPKSPRVVTQMITVRQANAAQLTQDLLPLLPDNAVMTANSSGNTLLITASEADVKRMAEIVEAIDSSISSNTQLKIFPLKNADAKELATIVKELFDTSSQRGGGRGNLQFNLGGGGGRGGGFGGF